MVEIDVKSYVEDLLDELLDNVQSMRESGETDLRTVVYKIENTISKVNDI